MINTKFNCHDARPRLSPCGNTHFLQSLLTTDIMAESSSNPTQDTGAPIAEIDLGPSKLDQFLDNHQTKLIILAILVGIGVVAYVIYDGLAQAEANDAGAALLSSKQSSDYEKVIQTWPASNAAASARLLLADIQWSESEDDSIATLEQFISTYPEHPSIGTAKTSLGLRLLDQGKTEEARDILTEVADNNTYSYIAPMAAIVLGDIAKAAGDTSSASEWYEKAQLDEAGYGNAFQSLANARLMLVNAEPPAKIKPALPSEDQDAKLTPLKLEAPDTAEAQATKPAAAAPATAEAPAKTAPNPAPAAPAGKKAE